MDMLLGGEGASCSGPAAQSPPRGIRRGHQTRTAGAPPPTHTQGSHCSHVGSSLVYFVPNKTKNHHSKYLRSVLKLKAVWNLQPEHRRRVVRNEGSGHCRAGPAGGASLSALSLQRRCRPGVGGPPGAPRLAASAERRYSGSPLGF